MSTVTIKDINQPIEDSVDLGLQLDEKNFIKVKVTGTVVGDSEQSGGCGQLAANQTIELSEGDLAAVTHVLHAMHLNLDVAGKMNGKITATVNTMDNISADVGIDFADLSAGGNSWREIRSRFQSCQVGLKASVIATGGKNTAIKLDLPIAIQAKGASEANHITVHADVPQDSLMGTADVFKAIAARLAKVPRRERSRRRRSLAAGDIEISADLNVADLVSQLPHTCIMEKGTSLTSGTLTHETMITSGERPGGDRDRDAFEEFRGDEQWGGGSA